MAQDLRPRQVAQHALSGALLGALLAACGDAGPQQAPLAQEPRRVDTSRIADDALVNAVLDECHKPLRGGMDRVAAGVTLPDGSTVKLFARLPDALRVLDDEGQFLATGGVVLRLDGPGSPEAGVKRVVPATAAQQARVLALLTLLDAAALGPLYRANGCRRLAAGEFELTQPTGPAFRLRLRADSLLPASLTGPAGEVVFGDHLRTPVTWMAKSVTSKALGTCGIVFEKWDQDWAADFFAPPGAAATPEPERPRIPFVAAGGVEPRSATPFQTESRAIDWVMLDDPGTWPERAAVYTPVHEEIERQGLEVTGFPILFADGARKILAVPFRAGDTKVRLVPDPVWRIESRKPGRLLVVYPPAGDLAARCTAGEELLRAALANQKLVADGPICVQPWFQLHEGVPSAEKLASPTVRMFVPVR